MTRRVLTLLLYFIFPFFLVLLPVVWLMEGPCPILLLLLVGVGFFLLLRKALCWFLKINKRAKLFKEIEESLNKDKSEKPLDKSNPTT